MPDVVALAVSCLHCHCPITLYVSGWREALHRLLDKQTDARTTWECPRCHEPNQNRFPGSLDLVVEGHVEDVM